MLSKKLEQQQNDHPLAVIAVTGFAAIAAVKILNAVMAKQMTNAVATKMRHHKNATPS